MMKLYDLAWGPWPRRVTIYIKEKGISGIEIVPLQYGEQRDPGMMAKNPLSFIPVLELDDGQCLFDSLAIIEYLEELHPSPNFIGQDAIARTRMRTYMHLCNEFFNRCMPYYANSLPQFSRLLTQSKDVASFMKPFLDRSLASLEMLADDGGPFLMGKDISIADCTLYPMVHHNAENYGDHFLTDAYPKLQRWAAMFAQRESAACPLRDDGLREVDFVPEPGKRYWWQKQDETA
jgi:glutathione S-transferase